MNGWSPLRTVSYPTTWCMNLSGTWPTAQTAESEQEQLLALKVLADAHPVAEPGPNLVARATFGLMKRLTRSRRSAGMNSWASA